MYGFSITQNKYSITVYHLKMTTKEVHEAVKVLFGNYDHPILNSFIFAWESDFFAISKSGYSVEVEVKVSRQDFKKDFTHKPDKHTLFTRHKEYAFCSKIYDENHYHIKIDGEWFTPKSSMLRWTKPCESLPNKFYYACPEGLIKPTEVPAYSGLIYTGPNQYDARIVKPAPFLHKNKKNFDGILVGKYYHRSIEVTQLLSYYVRRNDLTDQQSKDLCAIIDRLR